jgi:hypothetical protein
MAPTTNFTDCQRFAAAVSAAGGELPDKLRHLLSAYELLSSPAAAPQAEAPILDAALSGRLDRKTLDKLAEPAALASLTDAYKKDLAVRSSFILLGEWHRQVKGGGADAVLDSLRPAFDEHAQAIERARTLINPESTAEQVIESGQPELVTAWQGLNGHISAIGRIALVARAFGPRLGDFPQIVEYANADNFRLVDSAIMCADGASLETDSAPFNRPDAGHRSSPWFTVPLRLHTIESAQARYNRWAADQWDAQHSGPRGGWIGEDGRMHEDPMPENPYRATVST